MTFELINLQGVSCEFSIPGGEKRHNGVFRLELAKYHLVDNSTPLSTFLAKILAVSVNHSVHWTAK